MQVQNGHIVNSAVSNVYNVALFIACQFHSAWCRKCNECVWTKLEAQDGRLLPVGTQPLSTASTARGKGSVVRASALGPTPPHGGTITKRNNTKEFFVVERVEFVRWFWLSAWKCQ